jgi:mycofactocin precursor
MAEQPTVEATPTPAVEDADAAPPVAERELELVEEDLVVEEVSIDGMCGVY